MRIIEAHLNSLFDFYKSADDANLEGSFRTSTIYGVVGTIRLLVGRCLHTFLLSYLY